MSCNAAGLSIFVKMPIFVVEIFTKIAAIKVVNDIIYTV